MTFVFMNLGQQKGDNQQGGQKFMLTVCLPGREKNRIVKQFTCIRHVQSTNSLKNELLGKQS